MRRLTARLRDSKQNDGPTGETTYGSSERAVSGPSVEDVFHDAAIRLLDQQVRINETLDGRTLQVFTIGSTVLPLTFALLNLTADEAPSSAIWALGAALGCYALLIGLAAAAVRQRAIEYRPDITTLARLITPYRDMESGGLVLREWVALEYHRSIDANRPLLGSKGRWVAWSSTMLIAECLCLAAAAGLTLFL